MTLHSPRPTRPKPRAILLGLALLTALLSTACARKTPQDRALAAAVQRYDRVRFGMTEQEVVALLGEPSVRQASVYRWQTAGRPPNHASLEVRFNKEGRIASIAKTRAQD